MPSAEECATDPNDPRYLYQTRVQERQRGDQERNSEICELRRDVSFPRRQDVAGGANRHKQ